MDSQQDTSGDYGYDLVHEAARRPAARPQAAETPGAGTAQQEHRPAAAGTEGDLEYDEAHDF